MKETQVQFILNLPGGEEIPYTVTRRRVKSIRIVIDGRNGEIRVSCPFVIPISRAVSFVYEKRDWIDRKRGEILKKAEKEANAFCDGAAVTIWGEPYTLRFENAGKDAVKAENGILFIFCKKQWNEEKAKKLFQNYLKFLTAEALATRLSYWEKITSLSSGGYGIRYMKSRWGSCNIKTHALSFNCRLAAFPPNCLDYVIVHELCHTKHAGHGARFYALLEKHYPGYKNAKKLLRGEDK